MPWFIREAAQSMWLLKAGIPGLCRVSHGAWLEAGTSHKPEGKRPSQFSRLGVARGDREGVLVAGSVLSVAPVSSELHPCL